MSILARPGSATVSIEASTPVHRGAGWVLSLTLGEVSPAFPPYPALPHTRLPHDVTPTGNREANRGHTPCAGRLTTKTSFARYSR